MGFVIVVLALAVWFGLGYIAARAFLLDFRNQFGEGHESYPFAIGLFVAGALGYIVAWICAHREALYEAHFLPVPPAKEPRTPHLRKFFRV